MSAIFVFLDYNSLKRSLFILATGVTIAGSAYAIYRYLAERDETDGAVIPEKANAEPLETAEKRVLLLGLDKSGKSSLLAHLSKQDVSRKPLPTDGFNVTCMHMGTIPLTIWEVGGSAGIRSYWSNFVQNTDILVFVVDSTDLYRLPEAGKALNTLVTEDNLKQIPIIIVANKQDLAHAIRPDQIRQHLLLSSSSVFDKLEVIAMEVPCGRSSNGQHSKGVEELEKAIHDHLDIK